MYRNLDFDKNLFLKIIDQKLGGFPYKSDGITIHTSEEE